MGGDRAAVSCSDIRLTAHPKVFKRGEYLLGYTSSFRNGQILEYGIEFPEPLEDHLDSFMVNSFMPLVKNKFREAECLKVINAEAVGACFLVGVRGNLYTVHEDFQVRRNQPNYDSVGSGSSVALGSLFSTEGMKPKKRVKLALKAASAFITSVSGPFDMEVL